MRVVPGLSMNENTFAPFSCTLSTNSTISFVFPDTEDIITTDLFVNFLFPVVKNSAAFSTYIGSFDRPLM